MRIFFGYFYLSLSKIDGKYNRNKYKFYKYFYKNKGERKKEGNRI